ncbi:hypothetical protein [Novosphingobium sp. JCM 18896]|uniref:hypothetical protein n=1 Tax=Novosphingobium sp. JCM 18896 TaxID=2989731 RepID=UPI00222321B7|nr:hypothetical protein [Novosphingobium sp. JCM 18896]MCW1430543.1 hypothetical protein [Novosphingobium sp. JCM 18896]
MIFALILFGCADDGTQCHKLATTPKHYEARVLCEADAEMALQSDIALSADYPTVEARCQPIGANVALSSGEPREDQPVASLRLASFQSGQPGQPRPR